MGVDAGIFAKNAKKYFWFDRLSNIDAYWDFADNDSFPFLDVTRDRLFDKENSLTTSQILDFLNVNVKAWEAKEEDQRYHAGWVRDIIKFVKAHPDDRFFVAHDHDDANDLIGEMNGQKGGIWPGEYMEWKP